MRAKYGLKIFGPKRDEVPGKWQRLHDEELYDLYSAPDISWVTKQRGMRWVGHWTCMGEGRGAYGVFVGRPDGKIPLGIDRIY